MDKLALGRSGQPKVFGKSRALGEVNTVVTIREFKVSPFQCKPHLLDAGGDDIFRDQESHLGATL